MEATIQSNNKAINIDVNVSINVGALKVNIQRGLQAIKRLCDVRKWSLEPVFRMIDAHPTLSNLWIGGWTAACIYLVFMYA